MATYRKRWFASAANTIAVILVMSCAACSKSLNSVEGPQAGKVYGMACVDLASLAAATEMPAIQSQLVKEGKCFSIGSSLQVHVLKTVMMPGDGKYSQFEYPDGGRHHTLWIATDKVVPG